MGGGGGGGEDKSTYSHPMNIDIIFVACLPIPMGHHSAQVRSPANVHSMAMY